MKKISLILALCLTACTVFACGNTEESTVAPTESETETATSETEQTDESETAEDLTGKFTVGFGRCVYNPTYEVPIGGYGNTWNRISRGSFGDLTASCIAITGENGETVLLIALDLGNLGEDFGTTVRSAVEHATGVPTKNILVNCSHTHSTPDMWTTNFNMSRFKSETALKIAAACQEAMADRKEATMAAGETETVGMNFVRRYLMSDGSWAGDNYGTFLNLDIVAHETEADPTLRMIVFKRDGGKDILLTNYQVHATVGSATHTGEDIYYELSPDFVGTFRDTIEAEKDCCVAYFLGGAGNINPRSKIEGETLTEDQVEYGQLLAKYVTDNYDKLTPAETGDVKVSASVLKGEINHTEDSKIAKAREIYNNWSQTNDTGAAIAAGKEFDIYSPHHANAIIAKSSYGKTQDVELTAISFGDIAIAAAPYEMFDTNANQIREASTAKMTFVLGYTNYYQGYLPDQEAWEHIGYEQYSSRFTQGSGEIFATELVNLINGMR